MIDTTNFNDKVFERGAAWGSGATMHMVERFTRIDADHLDCQFTIDDPATFTRPWTVSTPMLKIPGLIDGAGRRKRLRVNHRRITS